jgi:hypothetical protein
MEVSSGLSKGVFDGENAEVRRQVTDLLTKAYWMEIETGWPEQVVWAPLSG